MDHAQPQDDGTGAQLQAGGGLGTARTPRVALIELFERDGRVGRTFDVAAWPLTLGRALDNDVVVDDPWVAAHHARIAPDAEGRLVLHALESRNGLQHEGKPLPAGAQLVLAAGGAALQLGATRLRVRLPGEVLAPDLALPRPVPWGAIAGAGVALLLLALATRWINLDPGADYSTWLPLLVGLPTVLITWCGTWALLSKLFQHRFDFLGHLRIALPWMLGISLAESALPQLAASLAAPWLWYLSVPLQGLLGAIMVYLHLMHVLPQHPRLVASGVAVVALAAGATSLALTYRTTDSFAPAAYMSTLPLPALRLAGTVPPERLVQDVGPLAAKLAQRVKKARDDDADGGDAAPDAEGDNE